MSGVKTWKRSKLKWSHVFLRNVSTARKLLARSLLQLLLLRDHPGYWLNNLLWTLWILLSLATRTSALQDIPFGGTLETNSPLSTPVLPLPTKTSNKHKKRALQQSRSGGGIQSAGQGSNCQDNEKGQQHYRSFSKKGRGRWIQSEQIGQNCFLWGGGGGGGVGGELSLYQPCWSELFP